MSFAPQKPPFTKELEEVILRHFSQTLTFLISPCCVPWMGMKSTEPAKSLVLKRDVVPREWQEFASGTIDSQRYGVTNCNCHVENQVLRFHISLPQLSRWKSAEAKAGQ
jgi:hypothetical protein